MDVLTAEDIFRPDLGALKWKTVRHDLPQVASELQGDAVPLDIKKHYHDIILTAEVMHINGIPMFVTKSRNIHFGMVDFLPQLKNIKRIIQESITHISMKRVQSHHSTHGWCIHIIGRILCSEQSDVEHHCVQ